MHPLSQFFLRSKSQWLRAGGLVLVFPLALATTLTAATDPRISQITPLPFPSYGVRAVDTDGDGDLDLFREEYFGEEPTWIENLGNRMFSEPRLFRFDQTMVHSFYGDLDGDGRIDALQISRHPVLEELFSVHASLSGQNLDEALRLDLGMTAGGFQLLELFGDARVEILRLEPGEAGDQVLTIGNLLEDGSIGILAGPYEIPAGVRLDHAKAVDVDGDGDLDLHIGGWILERTGPQAFAPVPHPAAQPAYDPESHWADLDGDELPDVFTLAHDSLKWAKNTGAFTFVEQTPVVIEGSLRKVEEVPASDAILTIADSVNDGTTTTWHLKRVLATGEVISDIVLDSLASSNWPATAFEAEPLLVADLDGDGHSDVFRSVWAGPKIPLQDNQAQYWPSVDWGNAAGFDLSLPIIEAPLCRKISSALADLNGDGHKDLVVGPDLLGRFAMLVNDGGGQFSRERYLDELLPAQFEEIGVRIQSITSGDVDADGDMDLAVSLIRIPSLGSPQELAFFALNSGDGTFSIPEFPVGTFDFIIGGSAAGTLYDWDGDGDLDLVAGSWRENVDGVLSQSATPLLSAASVTNLLGESITIESYRVGDLDGDGRPDIISEVFDATISEGLGGGITSTTVGIGFSDAFGVIEEVAEVPIQLAGTNILGEAVMAGGTAIIDVNQDGHNDLVFTSVSSSNLLGESIFSTFWKRNPGNGSRLVANWVTLPLPMSLPRSEAGDFNGDGLPDYSNGAEFLTPRPSGPLISPTYDFTGGRFGYKPEVAHIADLDGDDDEDLIVRDDGELMLVRNLIIDERSGIAARLRRDGVLGEFANPDEDADGDGRSNALELLQGTDPLVPDEAKPERCQPSLTLGGSGLAIRYANRADAAELDLCYQLERSENLKDWTPVEHAGATHHPLADGWQETVVTDEEAPARAFYRVRTRHEVPETK